MSKGNPERVTDRREFLGTLGKCALGAVLAASQIGQASASDTVEQEGWGMLVDLTRCTGCESCVLACKEANNRPDPGAVPDKLSSDAYSFLDRHTVLDVDGNLAVQAVKRQCMHCLHPACVAACTVGALKRSAAGPVVYDESVCFGCRYCQYACPFGVPTYDWNNPLGLIHKCNLCAERIAEGEMPACANACPNGALRFGPRSALIAQAHAQIESNPHRYIDYVYGEHEVGGTSMLYLSAVPFAQLGFPTLGSDSPTENAVTIMERTPVVAAAAAAVAARLYWISKRHQEIVAATQPVDTDHHT